MKLTVLDRNLGSRMRAVLWIVASVVAILGDFLTEVEGASGVVTLPLVVSLIGNFTKIGDAKQ